MKKSVVLNDIEANLVMLAGQTRDAGIERLNEAFNSAIGPVLRAYAVTSQAKIDVDQETKKITLSWEVPDVGRKR